jgi:hypothetical protein
MCSVGMCSFVVNLLLNKFSLMPAFTVHLTVEISQHNTQLLICVILWNIRTVHSLPIRKQNHSYHCGLQCTWHACFSYGDGKDFNFTDNSRLTFHYLWYFLKIFCLLMHIEAGKKSQTSRFLSVLVLVVMKQIGLKWIRVTNLWLCWLTLW